MRSAMPRGFRRTPALFLLAGALLAAPAARAQEVVSLRVVQGGRAVEGVEIQVLFLGEAWRVGETDGDGVVRAPVDLVGIEPGTRIGVHLVDCGGALTVLLVPPGQDAGAECGRRGGAAMGCSCAAVGEFLWGEDASIDLGGPPEARPPEGARETRRARGPEVRPVWVFGAGAGIASFPSLDVACEPSPAPTVAACELTAERPTFRGALEYRPRTDIPFAFLAEGGWTPDLEVDQAFSASANPLDPRHNVVEVDVLEVGVFGLGRWPAGAELDVWAGLGYVWVYNAAEATTTFGPPDRTTVEEREDSGGRFGGRAGLDWWPGARAWGLRFQAGGTTGESDDASASWHLAAMLVVGGGW